MRAPLPEHQWLEKFIGTWTVEGEMTMASGLPAQKFSGTESARWLGGFWVVSDGKGDMPGHGPSELITCLGYDPRKGRYVSAFLGSMMPNLWVSEGTVDAAGKVLTLESEGPSMDGGAGTSQYRDVIEFQSDDHRVMTSYVKGADGEWQVMMVGHYRKQK
jgi:hypothetical protein